MSTRAITWRGDLVTVVVPALNEEEAIASCLDSICAQTHRNLQIIVVDGGSSDRTVEIVEAARRNDQRIELVHNPDRIIPVSLNLAVEQARGAWLVRVDAHSMVPVDYVALAVENLTTGRYGAVGGRKDGVGGGRWGLAIAAAMASPVRRWQLLLPLRPRTAGSGSCPVRGPIPWP